MNNDDVDEITASLQKKKLIYSGKQIIFIKFGKKMVINASVMMILPFKFLYNDQ